MFKRGLIVIEIFTVKGIGVKYVVIMQMPFVEVRCNHYLTIITESFSCEGFCNSMSFFGSDIFVGRKWLYVVNRFNAAFSI